MSPRERRLAADLDAMRQLVAEAPDRYRFDAFGELPEQYTVWLRVPGLARAGDGRPLIRSAHRFDAYLHFDYPRVAPLLTWRTPILHPNILSPSRNGGVCIGAWSPSESLADLCRRIARLVAYEAFSIDDALDRDAAEWVRSLGIEEGSDVRELVTRS